MRADLLALASAAMLALPALPMPGAGTPAAAPEAVPLSHGFFTPFMHLAALDIPEGIRPGAWVQIGTAECTAAFVVTDAAGALYITTAAHCTGFVGQRARVTQGQMVAALAEPAEFGTVVARWPQGLDAALVRIDPETYSQVSPTMIGWGGPTGLVTDTPPKGTGTLHHGWGWVTWYEQQTRCRRGSLEGAGTNTWWAHEVGGGGDSGSPIMTEDGRALGILDWGGGLIVPTPTGAFASTMVGGVRLDAVLRALNAQGWGLSLVEGGPVNQLCTPEPPVP